MSRQMMITIPVDDVVCVRVGTLGEYQEKCRQAALAPEERCAEARRPTTFQAMFGLPTKVAMREALGV